MQEQSQELSSEEKQNISAEALESLGMSPESDINPDVSEEAKSEETKSVSEKDPLYVQKRLKRQERTHQREMRMMQEQIHQLQSSLGSKPMTQDDYSQSNLSTSGDDVIQRAVEQAFRAKDDHERKMKEHENAAYVSKKYEELYNHLDSASDKYDDFDEVVKDPSVPFTAAMKDAAILLPHHGPGSAADVFYKLGKNKDELKRISSLHPLDQAREMLKLSMASVAEGRESVGSAPKTLGQVKTNPVSSPSVTEKTSVSELRRRMKAGWK